MTTTPRAFLDVRLLLKAENLSGLADLELSRSNLGLGTLSDVKFNSVTTRGSITQLDANGQYLLLNLDVSGAYS